MTDPVSAIVNPSSAQAIYNATIGVMDAGISDFANRILTHSGTIFSTSAALIWQSNLLTSATTIVGGFATYKFWNYVQYKNAASFTIDLTLRAKKGQINRAYGREKAMLDLIAATASGFGILVGEAGSGKTALVEELACRIANKEVRNFEGAKLIRFNLRNATGDSGAQTALRNFWFGGPENYVRKLIEQADRSREKGETVILFIDEIQDLLRKKIDIFDDYKEELGRKNIKIIGATTDSQIVSILRNRQGTGAGMERRIEVIEILPLTKKEAEPVIEMRAKELAADYAKKGFKIIFDRQVFSSIVELSEGRFPRGVLPDRAIKFLEQICLYLYNKPPFSKGQITIGDREVVQYYAQMLGQLEESIQHRLSLSKSSLILERHFRETFFPQQSPIVKPPAFLTHEADRFDPFFQNHNAAPLMVLNGDSKELLADVASQWSRDNRPVYRCDLEQLVHLANSPDGREALKDTLKSFKTRVHQPILIFENCNPSWCQDLSPRARAAEVTDALQTLVKTPIGQTVQKGIDQLGQQIGLVPTPVMPPVVAAPEIPREEGVPKIIADLFKLIEEEKIPSVILNSGNHRLQLPPEKWHNRFLEPLRLNEMIEWLTARQGEGAKDVPLMVYALYNLKDHTIPGTVLDMCAQVIRLKVADKSGDLLRHLLVVLDGHKSMDQIKHAVVLAQKQIDTHAFDEIKHDPHRNCPAALKSRLHELVSSLKLSVLWITEDSFVCRQNLLDQMATGLKSVKQTCTHLNYELIKEMPPALKALVLAESLPSVNKATIITIEEEALKDVAVMQLLSAGNYKVVCFRSQQKQQAASSAQNSFVTGLWEQGLNLFRDQIGQVIPQASAETATKHPFAREFEYIPSGLNPKELRLLINRQLMGAGAQDAIRPILQNLYLFLAFQSNTSVDDVFSNLNTDLRLYDLSSVDAICDQFQGLYGSKYGLSLSRIRYEANPRMSSMVYRFHRAVISTLFTLFTIVSYPIRKGAWLLGVLGTALSGLFITSVLGWIRRRIFGIIPI
jgi:Cdc6-like AAA superfamily ATPase